MKVDTQILNGNELLELIPTALKDEGFVENKNYGLDNFKSNTYGKYFNTNGEVIFRANIFEKYPDEICITVKEIVPRGVGYIIKAGVGASISYMGFRLKDFVTDFEEAIQFLLHYA